MRRELWETVVDIITAVEQSAGSGALHVTSLSLNVPVQVVVRHTPGGPLLFADVPGWRWRTVYDQQPGRLTLQCDEGGA